MLTLGMIAAPTAAGGGGGSRAYVYRGISTVTTDGITHTHSGLAIGTAAADRVVVVLIATSTRPPSSVTIAGITATSAGTQASAGDSRASIWYAEVPTGTTATVVITSVGSFPTSTVSVYTLTGLSSNTPEYYVRDQSGAMSQTLTNTSGSIVLALGCRVDPTTATFTWSGVTEDAETSPEDLNVSTASTVAGAANITVSYTISAGANEVMAVASWY